jgi:hypothetical protein
MLRRLRRSLRVSQRRARMARRAWVRQSMDASLPDAVADRVPTWATTRRGQVILGAVAVVVLLGWAVLFLVVMS